MDLKRIKAELYRKQRNADIWGNMAELNRINNLIYKINCRLRAEKEKEIIKRREERYAKSAERHCERSL